MGAYIRLDELGMSFGSSRGKWMFVVCHDNSTQSEALHMKHPTSCDGLDWLAHQYPYTGFQFHAVFPLSHVLPLTASPDRSTAAFLNSIQNSSSSIQSGSAAHVSHNWGYLHTTIEPWSLCSYTICSVTSATVASDHANSHLSWVEITSLNLPAQTCAVVICCLSFTSIYIICTGLMMIYWKQLFAA